MATSDSPLNVPNVTLAVARGVSAPEPTGAPSISSVTDNGDGTLTIQGSNFGSKAQAAPRLHDFGDRAFLNGTENTAHQSLVNGANLPTIAEDPSEIYHRSMDAVYSTSLSKRHANHVGGYVLSGKNSDVGKPKTLSAPDGGYESGSYPKFYVAQWLKMKYDPGFYVWFRAEDSDFSGGPPIPGESVTFDDNGITRNAIYTGVQSNGHGRELSVLSPYPPAHANLFGTTLNFTQSGASVVYPADKFAPDGTTLQRIAPGVKFMRCWDEGDSGTAFRFSITSNDYYAGGSAVNEQDVQEQTPWPTDKYVLMEFWADMESGYAVNSIDFRKRVNGFDGRTKATFDPIDPYQNPTSLNMSLFGFNASTHGEFYEMEVESIYADRTFQRVYLGNAPTWDQVTHAELQRPSAWTDASITANKHEGALSSSKWAYVVGPDGLMNSEGAEVQI